MYSNGVLLVVKVVYIVETSSSWFTLVAAALYILYPGLYLLGALFFFFALLLLKRDLNRMRHLGYLPIE